MKPQSTDGVRDPSGCRWCGTGKREHLNSYVTGVGWHRWTEPTWQQRRTKIIHNAQIRAVGGTP